MNVASRMESTGKAGAIQVTQETRQILGQFGFTFIERGLVMVKGKGELLTFYLDGKQAAPQLDPPPTTTTIETEPNEVSTNDSQQSNEEPTSSSSSPPLVKNLSTESPAHLTSVSSSTASPNSVRLNQDFVDKQSAAAKAAALCDCDDTDAPSNNKVVKNASNTSVSSSDDVDAQTPLLSNNQNNANTVDSNHFSIGEKDALLENAN